MLTLVPDISAEPLSVLVHDLRQPLSVIDACADYLNMVLPSTDFRARQQLELLQEQIGEANRIMHEALVKMHYADATSSREAPGASSLSLTNAANAAVTY